MGIHYSLLKLTSTPENQGAHAIILERIIKILQDYPNAINLCSYELAEESDGRLIIIPE